MSGKLQPCHSVTVLEDGSVLRCVYPWQHDGPHAYAFDRSFVWPEDFVWPEKEKTKGVWLDEDPPMHKWG